ncbi:MAG: DUF2061 domain-containing protein [Nannocystaceae bacterium]
MESKRRSWTKALSWRLIAVTITSAVSYVVTDSAEFALSIGLADSLIKVFAYYLHERTWITIPYGRTEPSSLAPSSNS